MTWAPNGAEAVLISNDSARAVFALDYDSIRDQDRRAVVLRWEGCYYSKLGAPNDEAIPGHPLYGLGLRGVLWAGVVEDSSLIRALEKQNSVHPRHDPARFDSLVHHIILTKESTIEVVAESVTVLRIEGDTLHAAAAAMAD